jgi:glycosyltransferase involved in cell wall biosynthesis
VKILIIPRTLGYGGAQSQAVALANELVRRQHDIWLMPFYGGGQLEQEVSGARLRLIQLNKRSRWDLHRVVWKLCQTMAQERFDAIYTLGAGPNLLVTLACFCFPRTILFWSVRKSDMRTLEHESPSDFGWLCPKMARFSDRIIFNSRRGLEHGIECGYPRSKAICIPNGINTDLFYPDPV